MSNENNGAAAVIEEIENNEVPNCSFNTVMSTSVTSATKEKRNWFFSLTRRKKSQSQPSLVPTSPTSPTSPTAPTSPTGEQPILPGDDNTEAIARAAHAARSARRSIAVSMDDSRASASSAKHKEDKNRFQRFRQKLNQRFHSLSLRSYSPPDELSTSTRSPLAVALVGEKSHSTIHESPMSFGFPSRAVFDVSETLPFTYDYKRLIMRRWLEGPDGPNRIMYKACCEMLNQVWYWGGISRRDAQKQLTDKVTGSFLVRDSETSGCQFTLSFRIVNVTLHYRLEYRDGYWHFEELQYESIVEMIEDILFRCTNDNFVCFVKVPNEMQPPFPVILKYPLSRYLKMLPLQDLCRRVIQRTSTPEEIAKLPMPTKILDYLNEPRGLVFHMPIP